MKKEHVASAQAKKHSTQNKQSAEIFVKNNER